MKCKHCGEEISDNSKFCSHCGKSQQDNITDCNDQKEQKSTRSCPKSISEMWHSLNTFGRIAAISVIVSAALFIAALSQKNIPCMGVALIQAGLCILTLLMQSDIIKQTLFWHRVLCLAAAFALTIPYIICMPTSSTASDVYDDLPAQTADVITMPFSADELSGEQFADVTTKLRGLGFDSIEISVQSTDEEDMDDKVADVRIGNKSFESGQTFSPGELVRVSRYEYVEPEPTPEPTSEPTPEPTQAPAPTQDKSTDSDSNPLIKQDEPSDTNEEMVWVTASGKKYHNKPDCGRTKNAHQVTLKEAEKRYTPCKKCFG